MTELRRAAAADAGALFAIVQRAFAGNAASGPGPRWKRSLAFLEDCLAREEGWCILEDGALAGGFLVFRRPEGLWLEGAFVDGARQGAGLGQRALRLLLEREPDTVWRLKTPAADRRDCHFYEKLGFVRTGEEAGHNGMTFALYEKRPAERQG